MKVKKLLLLILSVLTLTSVMHIYADETLDEGLYVIVNAVDNHLYEDTDGNRTDFRGEELKDNSDIVSFIYSNGEYKIAVPPEDIIVTYVGNTKKIIYDNLNLDSGNEWKETKTPYSLVYNFIYTFEDDNGDIRTYSEVQTIFVTVQEKLTLSEKYSSIIFNPLEISRTLVRLVGLNFTQYSTKENYYNYVCGSASDSDIVDANSCGVSFETYQKMSDTFNAFVTSMFSVVLGFSIILVIFRFVKEFFNTNPNQNNFRFANIIKKVGVLSVILVVMFNIDNLMLFSVHIFSIATVAFYNLVDEMPIFTNDSFLNQINSALDLTVSQDPFRSLIRGQVDFTVWLVHIVFGGLLNVIFMACSIYIIIKLALIVINRLLTIILAIVLAPIFLGYYLETDRKNIASKFFSRFFAALFSGLLLLIVSIIFIFLNEIFVSVIDISFSNINSLVGSSIAGGTIQRIIILVSYIMLMIFYVKIITRTNNVAEELLVKGH